MEKGSGTRSGLLWEIERILDECEELPQILLMENVPQVIGEKNRPSFNAWCQKLEQLGYKSWYAVLNGKDYEIPQNRERCFMVSALGDYYYEFPQKKINKSTVLDFLESVVPDKYYIKPKVMEYMLQRPKRFQCKINPSYSPTFRTGYSSNRSGEAVIKNEKGVRWLTPREVFRLMGVKDEDYDRVAKNQSDSSLFHLAGDSIITNCLMAIFKQML